ncbi:hypothetical protein N657DRAFT_709865 [Parathielavia appendiculata]|uniref:Polynucleotide adenylyltransferase n=1 Tax=Parathielavia appendiculata TaxID=2587402 RepID=A0AAN6Z6R5_9PEZI|nr:hypothetical protein N657DRAFT_709865 [Parathielavia appendiculata]
MSIPPLTASCPRNLSFRQYVDIHTSSAEANVSGNQGSNEPQSSQMWHSPFSLTSRDTALTFIPPKHLWSRLDHLRALYDKAYPEWPPHINLVYPFVKPEELAVKLIEVGVFPHKRDNTIYLCDGDADRRESLDGLRRTVLDSLGVEGVSETGKGYKMHLTMAQTEDVHSAAHRFLVDKIGLVPAVEWTAGELAVLVRERAAHGGSAMRLWGTVGLEDGRIERLERVGVFYQGVMDKLKDEEEEVGEMAEKDQLLSGLPYYYEEETQRWVPFRPSGLETEEEEEERSALVVASYNVLAEFEWPPSDARYPLVVKNILAENAAADVLVLQEVTDGFLSYLLSNEQIRDAYPFCSHGPPDQDDIEPLPSFLNIVVLSKIVFDWEYVSFHRKHKGSVVARFKHIGRPEGDKLLPVILTSVHLSHGLTDGAVAAKMTDIKQITRYLSETYPGHPWILAGDFNMTTSSVSIDAALRNKTISDLTARHLAKLDELFTEAKLVDAWRTSIAAGNESDDDHLAAGEQGATWDPTANVMAAAMTAAGGNTRPQRYDRILVRGESLLEASKFNMFGFLAEQGQESQTFASDHWGVRCIMKIGGFSNKADQPSKEVANLIVPVHLEKASPTLAQPGRVETALLQLGVIPSDEEAAKRKEAMDLLRSVILDTSAADTTGRAQPAVVIVPVGSYALDVWTSSSDIDVLCVGPFSASTFFALASQRLRKAAAQGVKILRRVRAQTGTMLELEVQGIKMDLQYCPATSVAERWPDVLRTPPSDPVWYLSAQTLSKLKAIRDFDYLRRSLQDLPTFRLAHRFIKAWANGIQISILVARVHKLLTHQPGESISPEDLLTTFFNHYAKFPWSTHLAFDPFFHRTRLPYTRTPREPLAILGYFPPSLNTALAASVPSTRTLASEFLRASESLAAAPSWEAFLSASTCNATTDFLAAHKSYAKIDVQYWGLSLSRGAQFLGWVESRCVMLLVDLHRRAPGLFVRMWPARFVERQQLVGLAHSDQQQQEEEEKEERDFRGCYLVGLDKGRPDMRKEDLKMALGALQTALGRFEAQIRGDVRYFDSRSCWLSAAVVNRAELGQLKVDRREWGECTPGDEELDEEEELTGWCGADEENAEFTVTGNDDDKKKKGAGRRPIAAVDLRPDKTKKFRTAADAMNRIRWDPQLDSSDYVVGYEDRFLGVQEKELEAWKSEQTDEEFIPQHRILYFRRKSDGRTMWDRRTRFDELFGNGS